MHRSVRLSLSFLFVLAAAGCSSSNSGSTSSTGGTGSSSGGNSGGTSTPKLQISGTVMGGQQPVIGASVQIYGVGTTGDASPSTQLAAQSVTTDANGSFTITALDCTGVGEVYVAATGGNAGAGTNPALKMMTALGPCSSITSSTTVTVNEVTTVAAVYALTPYIGSATAIGSSSSDTSKLTSAFSLAAQLVNPSTGVTPGTGVPAGSSVPTAEINTLADIVSACVETTGGTAGDMTPCGKFFTLTTVGTNPAPKDTLTALENLASNPSLNTTALFALTPVNGPYQPALTSAPPDLNVRLTLPASSLALQLSPASLSFGSTAVNFSAAPQSVKIQNSSSSSVTLNSILLIGTNAQDFSLINGCPGSLAGQASCTVQVTATPAANGARNAFLEISSSSPDSPQYVSLSVTGTAPAAGPVSLTPAVLNFTLAGTVQDITLANYGSTPLTISNIQESDTKQSGGSGGFAVVNSTCGTSLAAQSVCIISVSSLFATGDYTGTPMTASGTIKITDDATTGPQTVNLASQNLGTIGAVVTFPAGQIGITQTAHGMYSGYNAYEEYTWPALSFNLNGSNPSDFATSITQNGVATSPCSPGRYGQNICDVTYTFTPSSAGVRTAKAFISNSTQYVLLRGTGVGPGPSFTLDHSSLSLSSYFPLTPDPKGVDTAALTLNNTGTTTLTLAASVTGTASSALTADVSKCASVAPQATCSIALTFAGTAVGTISGDLVLKDSNSTFSLSVPFTATTNYWYPAASPSGISFTNQAVGTTSASQSFTIGDAYNYPLGHPISVSLPSPSNFVLTQGSSCPASTTQTCSLAVAFTPQVAGYISEYLTITDQTSGQSNKLLLSGTGGGPAISLSTVTVTFPARTVGTISVPAIVTLTNSGTQTLNVSAVTLSGAAGGNFTEMNNCSTVAVNATCSINITFAPQTTGLQSANIQITSNSLSGGNSIAVSGTGQ